MILDQCIFISRYEAYVNDYDNWSNHASNPEYSITTSQVILIKSLEGSAAFS